MKVVAIKSITDAKVKFVTAYVDETLATKLQESDNDGVSIVEKVKRIPMEVRPSLEVALNQHILGRTLSKDDDLTPVKEIVDYVILPKRRDMDGAFINFVIK